MTTEPEAPTDLSVLMSIDPLDLSRQDLDQIIAYQRRARQQREGGVKTKKPKGDSPKVDIKALMSTLIKPAAPAAPAPTNKSLRRGL